VSAVISIQLDAVEAMAGELAALARALSDDVELCSSAAGSFLTALGQDDGWRAGAAGGAWRWLLQLLAEDTCSLATTLHGAVAAYRAADAGIAGGIDPGLGHRGGPR
jgi:hypothetical protein